MRDLTLAELDLIAGGYYDSDDEDIVVTGSPYPSYQPPTYYWPPSNYGPSSPPPYYYGGGSPPATPPPDNSFAGQHLHMNVPNPSEEQKHAASVLHDRLNADYDKIQSMDPNATMTIKMSDGTEKTVTGAEAKALFNSLNISIDPSGSSYGNGTGRGASTDANGVTHYNVDTLTSYIHSTDAQSYQDKSADYLLFHELAHNTGAGQAENSYEQSHSTKDANNAYADNERFANTIARAIEQYLHVDTLDNATYGYDSNDGFSSPPPPPDTYDPGNGGWGDPQYPGVS